MRRLLPLLLAGCAATPPVAPVQAPLAIPPLGARAPEPEGLRFTEGALAPSGCFARSRRTGAIACVTGHFHPNGDGERRLHVLANDDEPRAPIDLSGGPVLAEASRSALNELVREGELVPLTRHPSRVTVGPARAFGPFRVELQRTFFVQEVDERSRQRSDLVLLVTADADPEPTILFRNILGDVVCDVALVEVRELDPRTILVERECRIGDEVYLAAALCSGELGRCD